MIKNNLENKLYSLQEVAKLLRVSERSVFRYIHGGKLRASKIGYWRISDNDLRDFLMKNENIRQTLLKKEIRVYIKRGKNVKKKK